MFGGIQDSFGGSIKRRAGSPIAFPTESNASDDSQFKVKVKVKIFAFPIILLVLLRLELDHDCFTIQLHNLCREKHVLCIAMVQINNVIIMFCVFVAGYQPVRWYRPSEYICR